MYSYHANSEVKIEIAPPEQLLNKAMAMGACAALLVTTPLAFAVWMGTGGFTYPLSLLLFGNSNGKREVWQDAM